MGRYIVCPKCGSIEGKVNDWREAYEEIREYEYRLGGGEEGEGEVVDSKHIYASHSCGFFSECYSAEDFEVEIENGEVKDYGDYWAYNLEELVEIVKQGVER